MTKYIIKNCPAYDVCDIDWDCVANDVADLNCKDCSDCLLKQIVKKCQSYSKICKDCGYNDCLECEYLTGGGLASTILSMLEMQEVEDGNFR